MSVRRFAPAASAPHRAAFGLTFGLTFGVLLSVAAALAGGGASAAPAPAEELPAEELPELPAFAGMPLTEALRALQARGLDVVFSSHLVRPEMRVTAEPTATSLRGVLDELLAPHGLEVTLAGGALVVVKARTDASVHGRVRERGTARPLADVQLLIPGTEVTSFSDAGGVFTLSPVPPGSRTVEARRPGYVVERLPVEVVAGRASEVVFELVPAPVPLDEIVVTPSTVSLLRDEPAAVLAFARDEIVALPHLGDDLFRALTLLPGISGSELSAEFHVRGGRSDEVLVMLDQLELFEPFHLRDFSNALSIVAPRAVGEVELNLGGFPARFGDRMGGVLDMRTAAVSDAGQSHLGVSVLSAHASRAATFGDGRGSFLGTARYGSLELASSYLSDEEQPSYWDAFGKVEQQLAAGHRLGARLLRAADRLDFALREEEDFEQAETRYGSSYLWLNHQALFGSHLLVESVLSGGRIDQDRRASEEEGEDEGFVLRDARTLEVAGVKQEWSFHPDRASGWRSRHSWRWGFDARRLDADYDYFNVRELEDPLDDIRTEPRSGTTVLRERLRGEQYGVYLSDRWQPWPRLTLEAGVRYDEQTITRDRDLSPRLNLALELGRGTTLRGAWGHYFQSHRPYELLVEDGETALYSAERTESYVVGIEHHFGRGALLRFDLYHRDVTDPRPRYENVYEPVTSFPEVEPDRVRIAPERSAARGVELFLRSRRGRKVEGWLSYAYARTEDEIAGRDVPRGFDQPHTVNADLSWQLSPRWTLHLAWRYHTGWPTTAVMGRLEEDDEGELEPRLTFGPLNGERLPDYHRLDLRLSRRWPVRRGSLALFLDLQNLYDRENVAGYNVEFDVAVEPDGQVVVTPVEETWGGLLPSFGVEWEF